MGVKENWRGLPSISASRRTGLGGVPIVQIKWSELEIPLELAGVRVEGDYGIE